MGRRVWGVSSAVAGVALLVAGCSGDDGSAVDDGIQAIEAEDGEAEGEPAPEADSEPAPDAAADREPGADPEPDQDATDPDDPFAFDDPSEIDADYVDRVMAELLAVEAAVLDDVLESDPATGLTEADGERLRAVLSGPRLLEEGQSAQNRATDVSVRSAFLPSETRTGLAWRTETVVGADPECVVAIGNLDNTGVAVEPYPADEFAVVALSRVAVEDKQELQVHNPTPWRVHQVLRLIFTDTGEPVPADEFATLDYRDLLDLPCEGPIQ